MGSMKQHRLRRIGAAALALTFGVLLLEGLLQVAALVLSEERVRAWGVGEAGSRRVLTIGDSNTYGLYVDDGESYPSQLETLWNARAPSEPLSVANAGFPGNNSSQAARDLPRLLDSVRPEVLIVMLGVNDFWTLPAEEDESLPSSSPLRRLLERHSRLYRLFYGAVGAAKVSFTLDHHEGFDRGEGRLLLGEEEIDVSWARSTLPRATEYREDRAEHLRRIARLADERGARLFLMTYPARVWPYSDANESLRAVARATGRPLVDQEAHFRSLCADPACEKLLYPDHHPRAEGYRIMAEQIVEALRENLR
jgi:lysophospholipase L1-like esterase